MKCNAMLFNLERAPNKDKTGTNNFLTFVDIDTGESFRTFVTSSVASTYKKFAQVEIDLAVSVSEYQGRPQLNTRIINMNFVNSDVPIPDSPAFSKPENKTKSFG